MRTFFAIDFSPDCKKRLGVYMEALDSYLVTHFKRKNFRWVKPEDLHLTLQFIGHLREEDLAHLLLTVRKELIEQKAFYLKLNVLEWFPSMYKPHVISLQTNGQERLATLAKLIGKGIAATDYVIENRPYRGHITLARLEDIQNVSEELLNNFGAFELPEVFVKEVVFFRSEMGSGGSCYTKLAAIELANDNK